jgi:hypothetical protein
VHRRGKLESLNVTIVRPDNSYSNSQKNVASCTNKQRHMETNCIFSPPSLPSTGELASAFKFKPHCKRRRNQVLQGFGKLRIDQKDIGGGASQVLASPATQKVSRIQSDILKGSFEYTSIANLSIDLTGNIRHFDSCREH